MEHKVRTPRRTSRTKTEPVRPPDSLFWVIALLSGWIEEEDVQKNLEIELCRWWDGVLQRLLDVFLDRNHSGEINMVTAGPGEAGQHDNTSSLYEGHVL